MFSKLGKLFKSDKTKIYRSYHFIVDETEQPEESFRILSDSETELADNLNNQTVATNPLNMEDFEFISPIPEERYNEVIVHLRNNFFADEPLNKSLGLCEPGEPHAELEAHSLNTLHDQLSVMAVDKETDQVVAVSLNGIQFPGDIKREKDKLAKMTDEKFKQIFTLLNNLNESLDLFTKYDVDKIFDARILSVDSGYRGKGLGKEIIRRAEEVASENNFQIMKGDATGAFSQKILLSLGWKLIHELKYVDHLDENGEQIFKPPPPHQSLKIMIKKLN
ncbi:arylalkylamine N-acetyltransferase 1 isoform X1 [Homalodisca vitripennis]|uniref:arylalkylamine N-acetyltransferase 1 isoform X1 n=2 Tax=Homalodisca vitripennis TaxID=197043 RepID=UPI001EECD082|nr:arylalkylamine N-acetyltransferase 1 isoform X1 [Homalodisca vitripennis]